MTNMQRKEYTGIDYFRLISAFLVVAIHTSPLTSLNTTADFILTRVIARVAVPFFFMASGFFLFSKKEEAREQSGRLMAFVKKTAELYGITILLYLPLNIYTGTIKEWRHLPNLLKAIIFDGTFYHLWYLPAAILGACITWLLLKRRTAGQALGISMVLYLIGLFGDSYYGISEKIPFLKAVYQILFRFTDYTRNGLFFAPIFFLLGAFLAQKRKRLPLRTCLLGLTVSFGLLLIEALLLYKFHVQRHDSMYIMLLPCMIFLFQSLLLWEGKSRRYLRNLSMFIYLIHPAMIVAIRGFAKAAGMQKLLIDNSILHYIAVAISSLGAAAVLSLLARRKPKHTADAGADRDASIGSRDRAWAEINRTNLNHNVKEFQKVLPAGCEIMAVVKANAYGHGVVPVSAYLSRIGIRAFAVATIDEGIRLRKEGIQGEILILGYTPAVRAAALLHYQLSQTVVNLEHAKELNQYGRPICIHIKVNTGMNRLGESYQHASEIESIFACKNLKVSGIFTHLSASDSREESDVAFTKQQIQNFYELIDRLKAKHIPIPPTHIQSSYGVLNYPELKCSYARIGIALYGVLSSTEKNTKCSLDLQPVMELKSRVVLVRTIKAGESVSYSRTFIAQRERKIAVISIGYADGFPRSLSEGKSHVLIRGYRVPVIGRICMDQLVADVTDIPDIRKGDIATLIGKDGLEEITAEQVAGSAGTITNELLSRLSDSRLKRVFYDL